MPAATEAKVPVARHRLEWRGSLATTWKAHPLTSCPPPVASAQDRWHKVRALIRTNRPQLTRAAGRFYPQTPRIAGSELMCRPEWVPQAPLPLDAVPLTWVSDPPPWPVDGLGAASEHVRPPRLAGGRYPAYADAVADLDRPALFENRVCYRLLDANLTGSARRELSFSRARFFDSVNVGHAMAHELADAWDSSGGLVSLDGLPLRARAGDPCALSARPAVPAVTTLTLRREPGGAASFLLHWRDPAKVAHAGGVYQVMPAGIFQPAADTPAAERHDLSLWRAMTREYSEELLGTSEILATGDGRLDYGRWPFYRQLSAARAEGAFSVWGLAIGVDPLTFATDILTVAVIDAGLFDFVFAGLVETNDEGRVVREAGSAGIPFTEANVARFSDGSEPMQAAGTALLQLAWQHRAQLLG